MEFFTEFPVRRPANGETWATVVGFNGRAWLNGLFDSSMIFFMRSLCCMLYSPKSYKNFVLTSLQKRGLIDLFAILIFFIRIESEVRTNTFLLQVWIIERKFEWNPNSRRASNHVLRHLGRFLLCRHENLFWIRNIHPYNTWCTTSDIWRLI